jgi:hypothetical protein
MACLFVGALNRDLGEIQRPKRRGSLDQDQGTGLGPTCSDRSKLPRRFTPRSLRLAERRKQDPAIVDQVLKAMRGHIQGRDIDRVLDWAATAPDVTQTRGAYEILAHKLSLRIRNHNRYEDDRNCGDGEYSFIFLIADALRRRNGQQYRPISWLATCNSQASGRFLPVRLHV